MQGTDGCLLIAAAHTHGVWSVFLFTSEFLCLPDVPGPTHDLGVSSELDMVVGTTCSFSGSLSSSGQGSQFGSSMLGTMGPSVYDFAWG